MKKRAYKSIATKNNPSAKNEFDPSSIEAKWQRYWIDNETFSPNIGESKNPFYNLMMFPYPSAEGMHVGNMYAFTGADVYARFKRLRGFDVFVPIGLDGFGIHSENYALKIGTHPMEQVKKSQENFYRQMRSTGISYDWQRTVETYDPDYYRWTQWIFIQMFKSGLAYRKKAEVNWCPSCKTVLSDEQVIAGECERCGSVVEKRNLEQWFFRITDYAQRLLKNLETLDWTEKVKIAQREWIGKSEGALIEFPVQDFDSKIQVFTTRPDTIYGATFLVLAPEHPFVQDLIEKDSSEEFKKYIKKSQIKSKIDRAAEEREKTGVFSGEYAINPLTHKKIPIWVADYILMGYGTGAIMAVPAHDQRDFEFAKKYNLEIIEVIEGENTGGEAYTGEGKIKNSGDWNGFKTPESMSKVINDLERREIGMRKTSYHLRDWLISRQRYWGAPIPMIYCQHCAKKGESWLSQNMPTHHHNQSDWNSEGWYPVSEDELPVMLPYIQDYKPLGTGKAPLASHEEFYKTVCPECGSEAVRETDVSDTFLDSSWYFLRYPSTEIENEPFDIERTKKWLPVNMYIGGAEHSVLHLLYSRFVTMVLHDLGYLSFEEPFSTFFAHGLIIKHGAKMSKSKGNVVVPDEYIAKYGADALRAYLMFLGPFSQGGDFRDTGMEGMFRFLRRVWRMIQDSHESQSTSEELSEDSRAFMHKTIKAVTEDISSLSYNTAIARLMEWYNFLSERSITGSIDSEFEERKTQKNLQASVPGSEGSKERITQEEIKIFLKLLAPFAPHMTEELWHSMGFTTESESVHFSKWPEYEEKYLLKKEITIPIQINGKRRGEIRVESRMITEKEEIEKKAEDIVKKYLESKSIKTVVYIPGKIINFVV